MAEVKETTEIIITEKAEETVQEISLDKMVEE